jgi:hypothetical protein
VEKLLQVLDRVVLGVLRAKRKVSGLCFLINIFFEKKKEKKKKEKREKVCAGSAVNISGVLIR